MDDEQLARYLQQQEDGHFSPDESDTDSWGNKKKKRKTVAAKKSPKAKKTPSTKVIPDGKKTSSKPVPWTPEEDTLFLEGLELYGRDWVSLAAHCGGKRDKNNIKSHAQKYFIKLYIAGNTLPEKVKESGDGFTLSGKPLDPNSAALKAYSDGSAYRKALHLKKKQQQDGVDVTAKATTLGDSTLQPKVPLKNDKSPPLTTKAAPKQKEKALPKRKGNVVDNIKERKERAEYASRRLRTTRKQTKRFADVNVAESDPLAMVTTKSYSEDGNEQPLEVTIVTQAAAVMDFHAHLAMSEIIGLLAGTWDPITRVISIKQAFPCREMQNGDNAAVAETQVEMDPASEMEIRDEISKLDLQVVGWYHSHPTFKPFPSNRDVENQYNYQMLFQGDNEANAVPFVGAIVGPYDQELPSEKSVFNWFHVQMDKDSQKTSAYILKVPQTPEEDSPTDGDAIISVMHKLIDYYKVYEHRIPKWSAVWRYCKQLAFDKEYEAETADAAGTLSASSDTHSENKCKHIVKHDNWESECEHINEGVEDLKSNGDCEVDVMVARTYRDKTEIALAHRLECFAETYRENIVKETMNYLRAQWQT
eukprot:CFRG0280T1